jgi:hypothetical protein
MKILPVITVKYVDEDPEQAAHFKAYYWDIATLSVIYDYTKKPEVMAAEVAERFLNELRGDEYKISGAGLLSNGMYVFTLVEK